MPEMDIRRKYTYSNKGNKGKKKKKKEHLLIAIVSGLLPWKGDRPSDVTRKVVFLVSVFALTFALIKIVDFYFGKHEKEAYSQHWLVNHDNTQKVKIPIKGADLAAGGRGSGGGEVEILEKYKEFYDINDGFVGYLSIDPYINYPVVQSRGDEADDFYLHHNFYKKITENGTIYADRNGVFTPTSRPHNTIIHGHNLITKNNFQPLMRYRDSDKGDGWTFLRDNPVIKFDTLYEVGSYKIISVFQINVNSIYGEYYDYWRKCYFNSKDAFYEYVTEALDRSQYYTGVDVKYGDELLTLSTCDFSMLSDMRLVIVARRVRVGESDEVDLEKFVNNRENKGRNKDGLMKYKMFDAFYKMNNSGKGWAGRGWNLEWVEGVEEYLNRVEG